MGEPIGGPRRLEISVKEGQVVVDLGTPTRWVGLTSDQAATLAQHLLKHACRVGLTDEARSRIFAEAVGVTPAKLIRG